MATASRQTLWTEALWRMKVGQCAAGGKGVSLLYSYTVTFREKRLTRDRNRQTNRSASDLREEVMPQNVVQVGPVLGDLGQKVGD